MRIHSLEEFLELAKQSSWPEICSLILVQSNIGDEGAKAIAKILGSGQCSRTMEVWLNNNAIGNVGVEAFAEALKSGRCPPKLSIELSWNSFTEDGAKAIAEALTSGQCPPGLELYLSMNSIGEAGAEAIARALISEHCAPDLKIGWQDVKDAGKKAILQVLKSDSCPPIKKRFNFGPSDLTNQINELLDKNTVKQAALACFEFHRGWMQPTTSVSLLPLEMLRAIYAYVYPLTNFKQGDLFANNIVTFFNNSLSIRSRFVDKEPLEAKSMTENEETPCLKMSHSLGNES